MTTAIERLEALLNEKDPEIEKLEADVERLDSQLRGAINGWCAHQKLSSDQALPVPRLELSYEPLVDDDGNDDWSTYDVVYRLVYRHFLGDIMAAPLGHTTVRGGAGRIPLVDGRLMLPFRDGAHVCSDMAHLKLPGYAVCGAHVDDLTAFAGKPYERRP